MTNEEIKNYLTTRTRIGLMRDFGPRPIKEYNAYEKKVYNMKFNELYPLAIKMLEKDINAAKKRKGATNNKYIEKANDRFIKEAGEILIKAKKIVPTLTGNKSRQTTNVKRTVKPKTTRLKTPKVNNSKLTRMAKCR